MRLDDLKTWLLGAGSLSTFVAALSTSPIPLTAFTDATIALREFSEPTQEKLLFLDPQPDEVGFGTLALSEVTETINAYVIVTKGGTEAVMRDQAANYLQALLDCLATHPDYMRITEREYYDGVEGKIDQKGARAKIVFSHFE
jgi:hypothetical protein